MPAATPRLSRSAVIGRLGVLEIKHGYVTAAWIRTHDPLLYRSIPLHFNNLPEARSAAGLSPHRAPKWSRERVVEEVRRLHSAGESTKPRDLLRSGRADLYHAVIRHGGFTPIHQLAGARPPSEPSTRWTKPEVIRRIRELLRDGTAVAARRVPEDLRGARRCFGSWPAALDAANISYPPTWRGKYTRTEIIQQLQALARDQPTLRWYLLTRHVSHHAMCRLFGSPEAALRAAKIADWPVRKQGGTRDALISELRANTRAGDYAVPVKLRYAVSRMFGSADAARAAAKLPPRPRWTKERLIEALRDRARRGDAGQPLHRICVQLFGSMAAARRAAGTSKGWTPERVIVMIREVANRGRPAGNALRAQCVRRFGSVDAAYKAAGVARPGKAQLLELIRTSAGNVLNTDRAVRAECRERFGSTEAARRAAGLPDAAQRRRNTRNVRAARRFPWRRWSRETIEGKLRSWHRRGGTMSTALALACRFHFGSVTRALAEIGLSAPKEHWTPELIKTALRGAARTGGVISTSLMGACRHHFGSVTAARTAAGVALLRRFWTRETLIAELQARIRHGLRGTGPLLARACIKEFGSSDAALRAAGAAPAARPRRA
jgi:hypothetical protein